MSWIRMVKMQPRILLNTLHQQRYCSSASQTFPTTCPGANYFKEGEEVQLKPDAEYPDWLWTLGGPKRELKDMSPEVDGKAYFKRERKVKIREQNMIRKQRRF